MSGAGMPHLNGGTVLRTGKVTRVARQVKRSGGDAAPSGSQRMRTSLKRPLPSEAGGDANAGLRADAEAAPAKRQRGRRAARRTRGEAIGVTADGTQLHEPKYPSDDEAGGFDAMMQRRAIRHVSPLHLASFPLMLAGTGTMHSGCCQQRSSVHVVLSCEKRCTAPALKRGPCTALMSVTWRSRPGRGPRLLRWQLNVGMLHAVAGSAVLRRGVGGIG